MGRLKNQAVAELLSEYKKRLSPFCRFDIIELKDEGLEKEAAKIEQYLDANCFILDPQGTQMDSGQFSDFLKRRETIKFVIGGPEGIHASIKAKGKMLSLSRLTFPHELSRLLLIEQIYRAFMIIHKRKYPK